MKFEKKFLFKYGSRTDTKTVMRKKDNLYSESEKEISVGVNFGDNIGIVRVGLRLLSKIFNNLKDWGSERQRMEAGIV